MATPCKTVRISTNFRADSLIEHLPDSPLACWIRDEIASLEANYGGELSEPRKRIIRRLAHLELLLANIELKMRSGVRFDPATYTSYFQSMLGGYRTLGLERRQRPVANALREYLSSPPAQAASP
jgi:hypothetical protein